MRGIPGTGKTTICKILANEFAKSIVISQDDIRHMVIGGRVATESKTQPFDDPEEYCRQSELADESVLKIVNIYVKAGFTPIVDGFDAGESGHIFQRLENESNIKWYPSKSYLESKLTKIKPFFIILVADDSIIVERLKIRGWSIDVINFILKMNLVFQKTLNEASNYILIDTSKKTPHEVVEIIINKININFL